MSSVWSCLYQGTIVLVSGNPNKKHMVVHGCSNMAIEIIFFLIPSLRKNARPKKGKGGTTCPSSWMGDGGHSNPTAGQFLSHHT